MIRLGYACINTELSANNIRTGRTMTAKKFEAGGLKIASEIALANAHDLIKILRWNEKNGIRLFRIGSELFPRWDCYSLESLPDFDAISASLFKAGEFAREHGHRLTTHPGPFHILGSPKQDVVDKTIIGLERHSQLFDLMGFEPSFQNKINIHIGATYGDKDTTITRWLANYELLSDNLKRRLVIENDDKASMYSVKDLYDMVHTKIGIPITFDYYHHIFNTGGLSEQEAFQLARTTWVKHNITQCTHYSESRRLEFNDMTIKEQAHSDMVYNIPSTYGADDVDIVIEAKHKEKSIIKFQKELLLVA